MFFLPRRTGETYPRPVTLGSCSPLGSRARGSFSTGAQTDDRRCARNRGRFSAPEGPGLPQSCSLQATVPRDALQRPVPPGAPLCEPAALWPHSELTASEAPTGGHAKRGARHLQIQGGPASTARLITAGAARGKRFGCSLEAMSRLGVPRPPSLSNLQL